MIQLLDGPDFEKIARDIGTGMRGTLYGSKDPHADAERYSGMRQDYLVADRDGRISFQSRSNAAAKAQGFEPREVSGSRRGDLSYVHDRDILNVSYALKDGNVLVFSIQHGAVDMNLGEYVAEVHHLTQGAIGAFHEKDMDQDRTADFFLTDLGDVTDAELSSTTQRYFEALGYVGTSDPTRLDFLSREGGSHSYVTLHRSGDSVHLGQTYFPGLARKLAGL